METASESLAIGVNLIIKHFLVTHVGENPKEMKTEITQDIVVVLIRGLLPPADKELLEQNAITVASYQQLREHLFKKSEHVLRARVADFLQRGVKGIHYIFGTQPEDLSIIIYLEPS
jgi:uncharacterized protein YbcI